jgi:hypothetical protein
MFGGMKNIDASTIGAYKVRSLPGTLVILVALIGLLAPRMAASSGATMVVAGQRHTCAPTTSGTVRCWGYNLTGGLGDGTTTDRHTPVTATGEGTPRSACLLEKARGIDIAQRAWTTARESRPVDCPLFNM